MQIIILFCYKTQNVSSDTILYVLNILTSTKTLFTIGLELDPCKKEHEVVV